MLNWLVGHLDVRLILIHIVPSLRAILLETQRRIRCDLLALILKFCVYLKDLHRFKYFGWIKLLFEEGGFQLLY